jgi:putative ABC transport system permease protein
LYGLLSLQVARRQREFGIRTAFGATAAHLIQLVAKQGARLFFGGLIAGIFTTLAIVRLVQSQWAEMPLISPLAWIGGGFVLAIAVTIACWLPARRATLVDPVQALRAD